VIIGGTPCNEGLIQSHSSGIEKALHLNIEKPKLNNLSMMILGGAGKMAEAIERDLLDTDLDMEGADISGLVIADMNPESVNARANVLQSPKVSSVVIDVTDHDALVSLMKGHDVVVNAALTPLTLRAIKAALEAGHDVVVNAALTPLTLRAIKAALEAGVNIITLVDVVLPTVTAGGAPLDDIGLPTETFLNQLDEDFKNAGIGCGAGNKQYNGEILR